MLVLLGESGESMLEGRVDERADVVLVLVLVLPLLGLALLLLD